MRKKIALGLTSLLILTTLLTMIPVPPATAQVSYHWKIVLAQKNIPLAHIWGYLTHDGVPIEGTDFDLVCTEFPTGFVYTKVETVDIIPNDIHFWKDIPDFQVYEYVEEFFVPSLYTKAIHHHQQEPAPEVVFVVEVYEEPNEHDWMIQLKSVPLSQNVPAVNLFGYLTEDCVEIPDTSFDVWNGIDQQTGMAKSVECVVVHTPECVIPNDIMITLMLPGTPPYPLIIGPIKFWFNNTGGVSPQFPFREYFIEYDTLIEIYVTEVQVEHYTVMGGVVNSWTQLATAAPSDWSVPFYSRAPYITPGSMGFHVYVEQMDPITGVVKTYIPHQTYVGLDHTYYSVSVGTYFRVQTFALEQGAGWIFTGQGKYPVSGDVDILTWNNDTGVYTINDVGPIYLTPLLQGFEGPDGIPFTGDEGLFGDGRPDPPGSMVTYVAGYILVQYFDGQQFTPLFVAPWPQLFTTGQAQDTIIEPDSQGDGEATPLLTGDPMSCVSTGVEWKDPYSNMFFTQVCAWSSLNIPTQYPPPPGHLDVIFYIEQYAMRDSAPSTLVWGDVNMDGVVDSTDDGSFGATFGAIDEFFGHPLADANFDARCDFNFDDVVDSTDDGIFGVWWGAIREHPPP